MICHETCNEPGQLTHSYPSLLEVQVSSPIHASEAHHFDSKIEVPVFSDRKRRRRVVVKRDTLARRYFFVDLDTDCSSTIILAGAKLISIAIFDLRELRGTYSSSVKEGFPACIAVDNFF